MRTTKNISITVPIAIAKQAERLAKFENRTLSELLQDALRQYTTNHKAGQRDREDIDDMEWITRIIDDAKKNPMTPSQLRDEERSLARDEAKYARHDLTDEDFVRIIHEHRAKRNA